MYRGVPGPALCKSYKLLFVYLAACTREPLKAWMTVCSETACIAGGKTGSTRTI